MFKKDALENMLNSNEEFRKRFLNDPVGVLKEAGLDLSSDAQSKLKRQLESAKGSVPPEGASIAANGIGISIGKSF